LYRKRYQSPAAERMCSTRSIASHFTFRSSRPMWP
jgi:hypothetical protein